MALYLACRNLTGTHPKDLRQNRFCSSPPGLIVKFPGRYIFSNVSDNKDWGNLDPAAPVHYLAEYRW
jgi:hypothetical protein